MDKEEYKIQEALAGKKKSKIHKYADLVVGSTRFIDILKYELIVTLFSWIPGAIGIFLRSKIYP